MRTKNSISHPTRLIAFLILSATSLVASSKYVLLYSFTGGTDGNEPEAGVVLDSAGNAYGTTCAGGLYGQGVAYELSPGTGGTWTESVLYNFGADSDGACPESSLIFDAAGNLYGTTYNGGLYGVGTVFELMHDSQGWVETVIHNFGSSKVDGTHPISGVTFDQAGNLYGTTLEGGYPGWGTVYTLTQSGSSWTERIIYAFSPGKYGVNPFGGVTFDSSGNLYGTTAAGGSYAYGNVFKLTKSGNMWLWSAIYSFKGEDDGGSAYATPVFDALGNLYGTTIYRGAADAGTVYRLQPFGNGWNFLLLHTFNGKDGQNPDVGVAVDALSNVYGTTQAGTGNSGTVFELSVNGQGAWTEKVLHSFTNGADGGAPSSVPALDSQGNLFGTASTGGKFNSGTVFEVTKQ